MCASAFAGTLATIHNFQSNRYGANPRGNLVVDSAGNLYGTAENGGNYGFGDVYELTPLGNGQYSQKVLYSFGATPSDGKNPYGNLVFDAGGNLYGATYSGGLTASSCFTGCGTVFKLTHNENGTWSEIQLHKYPGAPSPQYPLSIAIDSAGNLYGNSQQGGHNYCDGLSGCGTVFELTPNVNGGYTSIVLHEFSGTEGQSPVGNLILDGAGNIFGATESSPTFETGTVYELSTAAGGGWTETTIASGFVDYPEGGVTLGSDGNLYGTTRSTVFELVNGGNGSWTTNTLYTFETNPFTYGWYANGSVVFDAAGNLYGATQYGGPYPKSGCNDFEGCGTVYQLTKNANGTWTEKVLHAFTSKADGAAPLTGPVFDNAGNLFVPSYAGATGNCYTSTTQYGCGGVVKLSPNGSGGWTTTGVFDFNPTDGATPNGGLLADGLGGFYGTTTYGGQYAQGEVFRLSQVKGGWAKTKIYEFTGGNDGANPLASLILDSAGNLYGTAAGGGSGYCTTFYNGCGAVFELSPQSNGTWTQTVLHQFTPNEGGTPMGPLVFDSAGNLFGTAGYGGRSSCFGEGCGMVFELSPAGGGTWTEQVLYSFRGGLDGGVPTGTLVVDSSDNVFGTASYGGKGEGGLAFKLSASGGTWTETIIHNFNGADAYAPHSGLMVDAAGNFYGTAGGGPNGMGVVFELIPGGNGIWTEKTLYNFNGAPNDGAGPYSNVTFDLAGNLYGTTTYGGTGTICNVGGGSCGTAFKMVPDGSGGWTESVLYSFASNGDGGLPYAGVVVDSVGNVYGTTTVNGAGHEGTVFKITQ
jgi:uncharacterized repeat protein (TIGR03803 family)